MNTKFKDFSWTWTCTDRKFDLIIPFPDYYHCSILCAGFTVGWAKFQKWGFSKKVGIKYKSSGAPTPLLTRGILFWAGAIFISCARKFLFLFLQSVLFLPCFKIIKVLNCWLNEKPFSKLPARPWVKYFTWVNQIPKSKFTVMASNYCTPSNVKACNKNIIQINSYSSFHCMCSGK